MSKNKHADMPYRPCVGAMVLNGEGRVWIGRRVNDVNSEVTPDMLQLWQMPQGGIDKREDPLEAAKRELYEETGIRTVSLLAQAPDWIKYDLPKDKIGVALKGKYRGQTQRWFAFRFEGDESEIAINPPPDGHDAEFDDWRWAPLRDLPDLVVPFKRKVYEDVVAAFAHLVEPAK